MIAAAATLALLWATIRLAPATPTARWLHRWLVEAPARRLSAIRRGTVYAIGLAAVAATAAAALDHEALRLLAMTAPEAASWLSMVEFGTLVEVATAVVIGRAALRMQGVGAWLRAVRPARRARRSPKAAANDGDADLRWAHAA